MRGVIACGHKLTAEAASHAMDRGQRRILKAASSFLAFYLVEFENAVKAEV